MADTIGRMHWLYDVGMNPARGTGQPWDPGYVKNIRVVW